MPFKPVAFESSRVKEAERDGIREARERVLSKAKEKHERRLAKEERARQRGDDKWMLPSLEASLVDESSSKKKHKKHKKVKKQKHKKHTRSSEEESSSEEEWVEKSAPLDETPHQTVPDVAPETQHKRDEWMNLSSIIPCITRDELRENKKQTESAADPQEKRNILDKPGQSERELNPYWRDEGTGLPEIEREGVHLPEKAVGDQGVGWLRKALKRVHEQAAETGQSPEDIAAERWGSLEKLESLLKEAENRRNPPPPSYRQERARKEYSDNKSRSSRSKSYDSDDERYRRRHKDYSHTTSESKSHHKSYNNEAKSSDKYRRPDDRHNSRQDHSFRNSSSTHSSSTKESKAGSSQYKKPEDDDLHSLKSKFKKPIGDYEGDSKNYSTSHKTNTRNWQKKDMAPTAAKPPIQTLAPKAEPSKPDSEPSDSSSSSESDREAETSTGRVLSEKEMNDIGAKIVKAEIMGNEKLASELKSQLEGARKAQAEAKSAGASKESTHETVILTRTDKRGMTRPLEAPEHREPQGGRRKKQKVQTHSKEGQRNRYFPDDDKYSLQELFTREKTSTADDSNYEFATLASKQGGGRPGDELDDMFEEQARYKESDGKKHARDRERAIREHKQVSRAVDDCRFCPSSKQMLKHLIIAIGSKVYLSLPSYQPLTTGHCLLAPTLHVSCGTQLDEDVWAEMQTFRSALTKMFASQDQDVVYFEIASNLRRFPHMVMECVPLDKDTGSLAPIYFKKAIEECEMEWSTNKKLVDLSAKGLRRSIPVGLPYFAVYFGDSDGFGHVIEDESRFPKNFAQEIIGGMLDLDHRIFRKRQFENFDTQRNRVLEFAKEWAPFDFTKKNKSM